MKITHCFTTKFVCTAIFTFVFLSSSSFAQYGNDIPAGIKIAERNFWQNIMLIHTVPGVAISSLSSERKGLVNYTGVSALTIHQNSNVMIAMVEKKESNNSDSEILRRMIDIANKFLRNKERSAACLVFEHVMLKYNSNKAKELFKLHCRNKQNK